MAEIDDVPIGSMVPLSGPSAADGVEFRNGLTLAAEEINQRGGLFGKPVRPIFVDTGRQTAEEVVRAANLLIDRHRVHAIINGYNIGAQNAEYEPIADAGILYIHQNTLLQHHDTVMSNRDRYFGCFMGDPAEYWYGQGFIKFISWLRDSGQWRPESNRIAIISGAKPYSIVIANAITSAAGHFGWRVAFGPHIVQAPVRNWDAVIDDIREIQPAVLVNTHFYPGDLAQFQREFVARPIKCLVYLQYGAMHQSFVDLAGVAAEGTIVSTVIGLLRDELGERFQQRYRDRFGPGCTPQVGCQTYAAMHHYALAVAQAGGSGPPGDFDKNRAVSQRLRESIFRTVVGTIRYHPDWQAAVPYPDATGDPSMGMPHLFYQIQDIKREQALIAPEPFNTSRFLLPPWVNAGGR